MKNIDDTIPLFTGIILFTACITAFIGGGEVIYREPPPLTMELVQSVDEIIADACSNKDLDEQCFKDVKAIAIQESGINELAVGDSGASHGAFQINKPAHPEITLKQAQDMKFASNWTVGYLIDNGYPEHRTYAIQCHNFCNANNGYVDSVKAIANTL